MEDVTKINNKSILEMQQPYIFWVSYNRNKWWFHPTLIITINIYKSLPEHLLLDVLPDTNHGRNVHIQRSNHPELWDLDTNIHDLFGLLLLYPSPQCTRWVYQSSLFPAPIRSSQGTGNQQYSNSNSSTPIQSTETIKYMYTLYP